MGPSTPSTSGPRGLDTGGMICLRVRVTFWRILYDVTVEWRPRGLPRDPTSIRRPQGPDYRSVDGLVLTVVHLQASYTGSFTYFLSGTVCFQLASGPLNKAIRESCHGNAPRLIFWGCSPEEAHRVRCLLAIIINISVDYINILQGVMRSLNVLVPIHDNFFRAPKKWTDTQHWNCNNATTGSL
jgi:hypothetical protein